jgi:hypothetical protein
MNPDLENPPYPGKEVRARSKQLSIPLGLCAQQQVGLRVTADKTKHGRLLGKMLVRQKHGRLIGKMLIKQNMDDYLGRCWYDKTWTTNWEDAGKTKHGLLIGKMLI